MRPHNGRYILMGKLAVPEPDLLRWGVWYETHDRHVALTQIGSIEVSTIFLGIDHSFGGGLPVLFETMVFRRNRAEEQVRCETWEQAEKQHAEMVEMVRREIKEKVND